MSRRSLRIHQRSQPKLPVEIQMLIFEQAALALESAVLAGVRPPKDWKSGLTRLCLVAPEWRTAGQRLLFRAISLYQRSVDSVSDMLHEEPQFGSLIATVDMAGADESEKLAILKMLHMCPKVTRVSGFDFTSTLEGHRHPLDIAAARPRLQYLSGFVHVVHLEHSFNLASAPLAHRYFDLSALRSLDIYVKSGADLSAVGFDAISADLRDLWLQGFLPVDFLSTSDIHFGRFEQLSTLLLDPEDSFPISKGPLHGYFPRLRRVTLSNADLINLVTSRLDLLEEVEVSSAPGRGENRDSALAVLHAAIAVPSRLPKLRQFETQVRFSDRLAHQLYWLYEVGPQLRAAVVRFVDPDDVLWREEWECEALNGLLDAGAGTGSDDDYRTDPDSDASSGSGEWDW